MEMEVMTSTALTAVLLVVDVDVLVDVDDLGDDLDGVAAVLLVLLEVDEPRRDASDIL